MYDRREILRAALGAAVAPVVIGPVVGQLVGQAQAQSDYPSGPFKALAMFGPGSGADAKVRFYANKLSEKTGRAVIVENKIGAMGNIATETIARSKPDGYSIYIAPGSSMLAAAPQLFKKLSYDPINDFEHITTLNFSAFALCVAADSPFKALDDLTAHLKQKGEGAFYGSGAPPSVVAAEIYKAQFGLKTVEVKYRVQNGMFNDLLSGQVAFTFIDFISVAAHRTSGKVRILCMACAERLKSAPDIMGAREAGINGLNIRNWWSVHVPVGTPKAICYKLEMFFNEIAMEPDTLKFLEVNGSDPMPGNSKMLRELLVQETRDWQGYAKLAKLEAN